LNEILYRGGLVSLWPYVQAETTASLSAARSEAANASADAKGARRDAALARETADLVKAELESTRARLHLALDDAAAKQSSRGSPSFSFRRNGSGGRGLHSSTFRLNVSAL
jgi:hypothetical protein